MTLDDVKQAIRPPFANYDIVVYFGCGLFSLAFIDHYLVEPTHYRFPRFNFDIGMPFADAAISTLSLLFSVYVLGHMLAYLSSVLIEKSVDIFFGKMSSAIIISTASGSQSQRELVSAWLFDRWKTAFRKGRRLQNALRVLALLPVLPLYLIILWIGGFEYYRSRVPKDVFNAARRQMWSMGYHGVGLRTPWFKTLEHVVTNNCPSATARMYNYLVISGTFRSISLLFLISIWCEVYFALHALIDGHYILETMLTDTPHFGGHILSILVLYVFYGFSVSSYMKFSRRYAEEAIFAFALARNG